MRRWGTRRLETGSGETVSLDMGNGSAHLENWQLTSRSVYMSSFGRFLTHYLCPCCMCQPYVSHSIRGCTVLRTTWGANQGWSHSALLWPVAPHPATIHQAQDEIPYFPLWTLKRNMTPQHGTLLFIISILPRYLKKRGMKRTIFRLFSHGSAVTNARYRTPPPRDTRG